MIIPKTQEKNKKINNKYTYVEVVISRKNQRQQWKFA